MSQTPVNSALDVVAGPDAAVGPAGAVRITRSSTGLQLSIDGAAPVAVEAGGVNGITTLTGDVTAGPGSGSQAATIAADAVTTAKILDANVTLAKQANLAANTVIGSIAGGVPAALTATQVTTLVNPATASLPGAMTAADFSKLAALAAGTFAIGDFVSASQDFKTATSFTVVATAASKRFIPLMAFVEFTTITALTVGPTIEIGNNGAEDNVAPALAVANTAITDDLVPFVMAASPVIVTLTTTAITGHCTVNATGTTCTGRVHVIGAYVN